jgi:uncharacterized heparinase superfamily protein
VIRTYLHTIRYLKPEQVYHRVARRRPRFVRAVDVRPRTRSGGFIECIAKAPVQLAPNRFRFLNQEREIRTWNDPEIPKLWLYHLHYFEHASAALIERWIRENPAGRGNGWEPYPIARRIVNWIKWTLGGGTLSERALASLASQGDFLSRTLEYHLGGNHLFTDAVALTAAGMFFEGPPANDWLRTGTRLLRDQIQEQILADGGHDERSPMYQALLVESLLDLLNISGLYEMPLLEERELWAETIGSMLAWLRLLAHPDGEIAFFNDAAFGIAAKPGALLEYASRLGIRPRAVTASHASGYVRLENGDAVVLFDAAPVGPDHQPGHAHADTLSFELSYGGRRELGNSGTSTYERGSERQWQRGTAAHNTIRVDGLDQSEVWDVFRVARRARPFELRTDGETFVEAAHDGYRRLANPLIHRRRVELGSGGLTIIDRMEGQGEHRVELFLHFHPEARARVSLDGKFEASSIESKWYPEFNRSVPNRTLIGAWRGACPIEFVTTVHPR